MNIFVRSHRVSFFDDKFTIIHLNLFAKCIERDVADISISFEYELLNVYVQT